VGRPELHRRLVKIDVNLGKMKKLSSDNTRGC
jgi:hypothetical protein